MKLTKQDNDFFIDVVNELLQVSKVLELDNFKIHGDTTILEHSIMVAYRSYVNAKKIKSKKIDYYALIRGAMLHDFFFYDWRDKNKGFRLHGYKHPKIALNNAMQYFKLSPKEKDIIVKHMWPLTIAPPKYKESWIVCFADKQCALSEAVNNIIKPRPILSFGKVSMSID